MKATLISFGYKYDKALPQADEFLDVRAVRNPHNVLALKPLTGLNERVQGHVLGDPQTRKIMALARMALKDGGRIAFGCFGGRHRSVAIAELLAAELRKEGWQIDVEHKALVAQDLAHA